VSGPKGKTLPLLANASWLSFVEPTLSDKPGLTSFKLKLMSLAMRMPPVPLPSYLMDWMGADRVSTVQ
jgi:hypothetical protein